MEPQIDTEFLESVQKKSMAKFESFMLNKCEGHIGVAQLNGRTLIIFDKEGIDMFMREIMEMALTSQGEALIHEMERLKKKKEEELKNDKPKEGN